MSAQQDFGQRILSVLNYSMLGLMIRVGHKAGLFDVLARLQPSTSQEVAKAAKLNERYVREWLGGMVTGRIVGHDPTSAKYRLP